MQAHTTQWRNMYMETASSNNRHWGSEIWGPSKGHRMKLLQQKLVDHLKIKANHVIQIQTTITKNLQ